MFSTTRRSRSRLGSWRPAHCTEVGDALRGRKQLSFSSQSNGRMGATTFDGNSRQMRRVMRSIFRPTRQARSAFLAEAGPFIGLHRRDIVAGACACGLGALIGAASKRALGADIVAAPARPIHQRLDVAAAAIEARMIGWRRDIHQHPELGNQEIRTAALVAQHLRTLGYEVREKVAITGVVATLVGKDGPGPALRSARTWTRSRSPSRPVCPSRPSHGPIGVETT